MKKLFILLISIFIALTFVACDNTEAPDLTGGGAGGGERGVQGNVYDGSPYEEDWRDGASYDYVDGVWDSYVLPDVFPSQPTTGTIDDVRTYYIAIDDPKYTSYVGAVYFPDENYFYYELGFLGNEAHQTYLVDALTEKGFFIDYDDSWGNNRLFINAFSNDYYVTIRRYDSDDNPACPYEFDCYIIPKQMTFPVSNFGGVPLPSFGYVTSEYDLTYMKYELDYSDWEDVTLDQFSSENPWYYSCELEGVKLENVTAYKNSLTSSGWTAQSNERYTKGTLHIDIEYDAEDGVFTLEAASDDMTATLFDY